jgi:two-component system CheB/CheR fusion protein
MRVLNILIVDAEASEGPVKRIVENCDCRAWMAKSGKEALEVFRKNMFDLVLLDMFLPDCMGYELIPELRKERPDIRIISTTAYSTREIERKNRALGVTYYMSKPLMPEELQSLLRHISRQVSRKNRPEGPHQIDGNDIISIRRSR